MNIAQNTKTSQIQISMGDNIYRDLEVFTHPITGKKLYCFISSREILPKTFSLHKLGAKTKKIANIYNDEQQQQIIDYLNN